MFSEEPSAETSRLKKKLSHQDIQYTNLKDQLVKKTNELELLRRDHDELANKLRLEDARGMKLEEAVARKAEELRRETASRVNSESALVIANKRADSEAQAAKDLQLQLDYYSQTSSRTLESSLKERTVILEARIKELETESKNSRSNAAKIIELENQTLALQKENARLLELAPKSHTSAVEFPFSTPKKLPPSAFNTPARGGRRRSSSVSSDLRINRLEADLEHYKSFEKAAEAAQAKLTKLQRDLMQVQNEKMASERLTTKNLEQLRMKLAEKEEELEELRFGGANTEQDDAEKVELEKKLKEKEMQMKAIMDKLAGVEAKLDGKVQEIQVEISTSQSRARSRSVTPRSSDVSTQLSEVIELRRVNASLQSEIERLQSNPLASSSTKPPKPKEDLTDQLRLKSQALDAMEIEVSDTQEALEDSRQDLRRCKAELQMFKGEMAAYTHQRDSYDRELEQKKQEVLKLQAQLHATPASVPEDGKVDELRNKVSELQYELRGTSKNALEAERREQDLKEQIKSAERKEADTLSRSAAQSGEVFRLQTRIKDAEDALATSRADVSRLRALHNDALKACATSDAKILELQNVVAPTNPSSHGSTSPTHNDDDPTFDVSHLLVTIDRLRSERDDVSRSLKFLEVESQMTINDLESDVHNLRQEVAQANKQIDLLRDEAESSKQAFAEEQRHSGREISPLRDELSQARKRIHQISLAAGASLLAVQNLQETIDSAAAAVEASIANEVTLQAQVRQLQAIVEGQDAELSEATKTRVSVGADLEAALDTHAELEAACDQLREHAQSLESNLINLQEELEDTEQRYRALRQERLSKMSSSQNETDRIKQELEELEHRVLRRNEQIGIHQKEIKRLETNLAIAEESNEELEAQLTTALAERTCMVADSREARDQRDEALSRVEKVEVEMESITAEAERAKRKAMDAERKLSRLEEDISTLDAQHTQELETIVALFFSAASRSRDLTNSIAGMHDALQDAAQRAEAHADREACWQEAASEAQGRSSGPSFEVEKLQAENVELEKAVKELEDEQADLLQALEQSKGEAQNALKGLDTVREEMRARDQQASVERETLAAAKANLEERATAAQEALAQQAASHQSVEEELSQIRSRLENANLEIDDLTTVVEALHREMSSLRDEHERELNERGSEKTYLAKEYEECRQARDLMENQYYELVDRFNDACEELENLRAESSQAVQSNGHFQANMAELKNRHLEEIAHLQNQLADAADEIDFLKNEIASFQVTREDFDSELDAVRRDLENANAHRNRLLQELDDVKASSESHEAALARSSEERRALESEIRTLTADAKRALGMHRYLEQQASRSEQELLKARTEIQKLSDKLFLSEQKSQAASINFTKQTAQLEQRLAVAHRELQRAPSSGNATVQAKLEEQLSEFKEKVEMLEAELTRKGMEAEELDDKFIEVLKDKKKLIAKCESLTRKVKALQARGGAGTSQSPHPPSSSQPTETPAPTSHSPRLVQPKQEPVVAQLKRESISTPKSQPAASNVPPPPSLAPSRSPQDTQPPAQRVPSLSSSQLTFKPLPPPVSRAGPIRSNNIFSQLSSEPSTSAAPPPTPQAIPSEPSTSTRPRVPSGSVPLTFKPMPAPVARAPPVEIPAPASRTPASAGKLKRRLPDDFEPTETLPPQAIIAETSPSRPRKSAQNRSSGFTPTRAASMKAVFQGGFSPLRKRTPGAIVPSDITNSPNFSTPAPPVVAQEIPPKRNLVSSWLTSRLEGNRAR